MAAASVYLSTTASSCTQAIAAATVSHGHFSLWMPADELEDASSNDIRVEVTYRDGTTATKRLSLSQSRRERSRLVRKRSTCVCTSSALSRTAAISGDFVELPTKWVRPEAAIQHSRTTR